MRRPSMAMHRILAMNFCGMTIAKNDFAGHVAARFMQTKFLYQTEQNVIPEIFRRFSAWIIKIAVCDPVYPVYVDSNVMAGRTGSYDPLTERWSDVIYMPCTADNEFAPDFPKEDTGSDLPVLPEQSDRCDDHERHSCRAGWTMQTSIGAVILFDAAYEAYISEEDVPHSHL